MKLVSQLFSFFDGLSGWVVLLLIVGGLAAIAIFAKVFESDFFGDRN